MQAKKGKVFEYLSGRSFVHKYFLLGVVKAICAFSMTSLKAALSTKETGSKSLAMKGYDRLCERYLSVVIVLPFL